MSRDRFEIPEPFRRAMEEMGWDSGEGNRQGGGGNNEGGDGNPRPPFKPTPPSIPRGTWLFVVAIIIFLGLSGSINTYTNWLWFTNLNYESVWLKQWGVQILSFIAFALIAFGILAINWQIGRRRAIRETTPFQPQLLDNKFVVWLLNGFAIFLTLGFASTAAAQWESFLLYIYRVPYGATDPLFSLDISFYLFELPIYDFLQGWILSLLTMTLLGLVPIYLINSIPDLQRGSWRPAQYPSLRKHVAVLGVIMLALWASGYGLDLLNLVYSNRGVVFGASYTDIYASQYALWAQLITMSLIALAVGYNVFRLSLRPILFAAGAWLVVSFLVAGVYPGLLQRYSVEPNELELEREFIEYNIELTRLAFGLDEIETRDFRIGEPLTAQDITDNEAIFRNVRVWDYRPLLQTYEQLQALRTYYGFNEVDIDRYQIDGQQRQVMLSVRELNRAELPSRTWVNENLEFTHGYGVVMNPVDVVTSDGQPSFFIKDLPPQSSIELQVTQPEVYYGELTSGSVLVNPNRESFSFPSADGDVYSTYQGVGGVVMNNIFKRLAFALRQGDTNLILSNEIDNDTRIMFNREIRRRVQVIAPFLLLDDDPYIVIGQDGRLVWMIDAYTLSNRFPYATPATFNDRFTFNYIRNSVKITVDAYNGSVDFYISEPEDPIIRTYDRAFPDLFKPLSDMPEDLQMHIRYPEDLFTIQRDQYATYHMTDARVFYNKEDKWQVPIELLAESSGSQGVAMEPYYVQLPLPGSSEAEYLLIQPYTPADKDNMVAWLAARNDPEHYGQLVSYELPRQELVFGPIQVETRISQEPDISQQFTLWNQSGSRIIRGNLIVMPIRDNFLYVEPIYLRSETNENALPELKRVIVSSDNRIVMRETLSEALTALFDEDATDIVVIDDLPPASETDEPDTPTTLPADATLEQLIESANTNFELAEQAQQNGDWAAYGEALEALEEDLRQLDLLTNP